MTLVFAVIVAALVFEYINGFHDTANCVATVVSTRVLRPREAIILAAFTNLGGAMAGTAVAKTVAYGLIEPAFATPQVLICALSGAIFWNLTTWWAGLPSSSSHALVGGLCGGALAAARGDWGVIVWSRRFGLHWYEDKGVLWKVIVPMATSPALGFLMGLALMAALCLALRRVKPAAVNRLFGNAQIVSAACMGFMHGANDAQKTMGIIALALVSGSAAGSLDGLPTWLGFLRSAAPAAGESVDIATWIKGLCALTMAAGTAAGGWRIVNTLGHKIVKLRPIDGFVAESGSAFVIWLATHFGIPISTTHNISASIMGVGFARNSKAVRWTVVERMVWAWVLTIPVAGLFAYVLVQALRWSGVFNEVAPRLL